MHFGLRGCKEHRDMSWGDVKLKKTVDGEEFLEFNERQTKTRAGSDCRDVRKNAPKLFATDGSERDPVVVYNAWKRPKTVNDDESPFYLAVNNTLKAESHQTGEWSKDAPVGINKLNSLMKTMAKKAGINNERLRNYSGRLMIQTLSENDILPTYIAQLSGHKNLKSLENTAKCRPDRKCKCPNFSADILLVVQPRHPFIKQKIQQQLAHPTLKHNKPWLY